MCNQAIGCLRQSSAHFENLLDQRQQLQQYHQTVDDMDTPGTASSPAPSSNEETPRVKFLCSFAGSILPRPQDGKLRYVGGETRIVSLPRDITFDELMSKMRELFEGAALLKYQQPDEDLDALVSVVNDDDVTNMMEEYDKLGSGDGFTRLRIFLFSQPDQDAASLFNTGESETERRYVDALNSLNDAPDFRKLQPSESPVMGPMDKVPMVDQFFNPMTLEASVHNQRNYEIPLQQFNLQRLKIPCIGSGQAQQSHGQRYNDMEAPWSPAYYSPGHHGHHDNRHMAEFPSSPSSGRYRMQFGEISDKCFDRMSEEFGRQHVNHLHPYEQQPAFVDNVVWLPPGALPGDKAGFPGNLGHSPGVFESNSICEYCRKTFQRNQPLSEASNYSETRWKHGGQPHLEQPNTGGEFPQFSNPCAECNPSREAYMLNPDVKLDHGIYSKEQTEHHTFYNEVQNHDRGWIVHQLHNRTDETRAHNSGAGRVNEQYMVDGTGMTIPLVHGNCCNGHQLHSNYISHEDQRHFQPATEMGNEGFHDQAVGSGLHIHIPTVDDNGVQYGNFPPPHGADNFYQLSQGHAHGHAFWRKLQNPMHGAPSYDPSSNIQPQANGAINPGFLWGTRDGSPRYCIGVDGQNTWGGLSPKILGFDGSSIPEYFHGHAQKLSSNTLGPESQHSFAPDPIGSPPDMRDFTTSKEPVLLPSSSLIDARMVCSSTPGCDLGEAVIFSERNMLGEDKEVKQVEAIDDSDARSLSYAEKNGKADRNYDEPSFDSNAHSPIEEGADIAMLGASDARVMPDDGGLTVKHLNFLPELIASVKKAAIYGVEEVKSKVQGNANGDLSHDLDTKEVAFPDSESVNANVDLEVDSDSDHPDSSSIEPTKAEEDALAKGLQTIKNDDLEEIRELGSGTYGSVFHGKWKGSDVAIKRIKASCFAGRPSERERLIADFWKEALILSSLHHPNVVSFYGIVRDGPDGSLATVTEFMINGSLKQFLQKKDRTIDRRKRLIIAMDAAIGMEYLHGKNIVHFDLKCENLLVNMRDPHRPVCKIGDLGLSKVKQHTLVSGGVRGTLPWMAPELLSGKSNMVSEKIDVYSFGIVMWELLTGDEPYADMHCASIIGGIVNNSLRPQVPTWCDPEWKSLMESCWASDPGERPSFAEISQKLRKMAAAINVK